MIERAQAYRSLLDQLGLTQAELAARLGEDRSSIANFLRLLELTDTVKSLVQENRLTLGHAKILANKISALGGTPAAEPAPVPVVAEAKEMLQAALKGEEETLKRYLERRRQAEEAGEFGLAVQFDDIIADETHHRDELRQMLARWP